MCILKTIKNLILCVVLCSTSFIAIGFANLSVDLNIDGTGSVYPYSNVHIVEANPLTSADDSYVFPNSYGSLFFDSTTYLSSSPLSEAKTEITLFNNSNDDYSFIGTVYSELAYSNPDIVFSITGLVEDQVIESMTYHTFALTFSYKDGVPVQNQTLDSLLSFEFAKSIKPEDIPIVNLNSNFSAMSQSIVSTQNMGLNDPNKGYVISDYVNKNSILYCNAKGVSGGNLKKVLENANVTENVYFFIEYENDTHYHVYMYLYSDAIADDVVLNETRITVYKQTILCDENGYWSPSTTLVGSAPVIDYEYHNNSYEHAVDILRWEPVLSVLE